MKTKHIISSTAAQSQDLFNPEVYARVLSTVERHFIDFDGIFPGWKCLINLRPRGDRTPYHEVTLSGGDPNHGTYAEAKMHTLDVISPNLYHTGSDNMSRLINALPNMFLNENDELLKEIATFQHPASIPMSMHERLKKDHNLALMYGAIRIPIIRHSCNEETFHEVRISFSGGSQEEDLITCFLIFRELQEALLNVYNDSYFTYILNPLKEDRHCCFNLKLFNLKECYPKQ